MTSPELTNGVLGEWRGGFEQALLTWIWPPRIQELMETCHER